MLAPPPTKYNKNVFAASGNNPINCPKPPISSLVIPGLGVYHQLRAYTDCAILQRKGVDVQMPSLASFGVPVYGLLHWKAFLKRLSDAEKLPDLPYGGTSSGMPTSSNTQVTKDVSIWDTLKKSLKIGGSAPVANTQTKTTLNIWAPTQSKPPAPTGAPGYLPPEPLPPLTAPGGGGGYTYNPDPFMQNILSGGTESQRVLGGAAAPGGDSPSTETAPVEAGGNNTIIIVVVLVAVVGGAYFLMRKKKAA